MGKRIAPRQIVSQLHKDGGAALSFDKFRGFPLQKNRRLAALLVGIHGKVCLRNPLPLPEEPYSA
jgi:hypothetical protein